MKLNAGHSARLGSLFVAVGNGELSNGHVGNF
jgi:hypothetical protein